MQKTVVHDGIKYQPSTATKRIELQHVENHLENYEQHAFLVVLVGQMMSDLGIFDITSV